MNKKIKFAIISLKNILLPTIFLLFTVSLFVFSKDAFSSAKEGLLLFSNFIIPSLFPFFVATELLLSTNIIYYLGKYLSFIMRPIFNIPGEGAFALIMGLISGYPIGAKIVADFKENNICSTEECERLLAFTSNSGPLFILGTVGIGFFNNSHIGILLLLTHILACISVGLIFRFWKYNKKPISNNKFMNKKEKINFSNLGDILSNSISKSIQNILVIGGFIVIFSVIISFINKVTFFNVNSLFSGFITGSLEITNGIRNIAIISTKNISFNIVLASFVLGFGGISILLQVFSIISKSHLSIKTYVIGKSLQAVFASFYTFLFLRHISFFNFETVNTISNNYSKLNKTLLHSTNLATFTNNYFFIFLIFILFIFFMIRRFFNG